MPAIPPRRPAPRQRLPGRVFGVIGIVGLVVAAILAASWIGSASDDSGGEAAATPTPSLDLSTPTPTPKPKKTPVPLTPAQKTERDEAIATVVSKDFTVVHKSDWDPNATLRVLIGRTSSGGELAFFFVNGTYLGNDGTETSTKITVTKSQDLQVTLRYGIYEPGDPASKPSGIPFVVNFTYSGSTLSPDQELPPSSERNPS
ncbi:MAG: hypothetical protein QOF76_2359 [Solirubrobacteraceae bacterium]|jgi:hypothetical protein|nr:hypothetical protein [Solirubrobacteraceae bacterium]